MRSVEDTLAAARRDVAQGGVGIPNDEWPFAEGNYCCSSVVGWLDDFGGHPRYALENISIEHLRADRKWPEGDKPRVGALTLMNFDGGNTAEHIGLCHGTSDGYTLDYEGNTGPHPGDPEPNGFYDRQRPEEFIVGYIYPPYPKSTPIEDPDMKITSHQLKKHQGLTSGAWRTIETDHPGVYSLLNGPASIVVKASLAFDSLPEGSVVQVRFVAAAVSATGKTTGARNLSLTEIHGSAGQAFGEHTDLVTLAKGERLRLQILGDSSVMVAAGSVAVAQ